jgi:hypothetical protein
MMASSVRRVCQYRLSQRLPRQESPTCDAPPPACCTMKQWHWAKVTVGRIHCRAELLPAAAAPAQTACLLVLAVTVKLAT